MVSRPDGDKLPVHLVDADEWADPSGDPGARGSDGGSEPVPGTTGRPRGRRWWVAAAVVATGAVVVGVLAGGGADGERAERLAASGRWIASLDEPLREHWRGEWYSWPQAVLSGTVVSQRHLGDVLQVQGVSTATGEPVWEHMVGELGSRVRCTWPVRSDPGRGGAGEVGVCHWQPVDRTGRPAVVVRAGEAMVAVLDGATGRTLAVHALPEGAVAAVPWDGDVVAAVAPSDGPVRLQRIDGLVGTVRWEVALDYDDGDPWWAPEVEVRSGQAVVTWGERTALYSVDGTEVLSWRQAPDGLGSAPIATVPVGGGYAVVERFDREERGVQTSVLGPAGEVALVAGRHLDPLVDDGSVDGVLFTSTDSSFDAWRLEPFEQVWGVPDRVRELVVLRGHLVTVELAAVSAWEAGSGGRAWTRELDLWGTQLLGSDGDAVLVVGTDFTGEAWLVALRARDGQEVWRVAVGVFGTGSISTVDGEVFLARSAEIARLGPRG